MVGASSSSSSLQANLIVEERNELMIPRETAGHSFRRTAHFLRPSAASVDGSGFPPVIPPMTLDDEKLSHKNLRVEVQFLGWNHPQQNWQTWIEHMHALHHLTWKESGIYEAIMCSKYKIHRNQDLIFSFSEKWCPETNTFVFPWGESTVTLEDVMALGGFSVLGNSNFTPIGEDEKEMKRIQKILVDERKNITKTTLKRASQSAWVVKFMNSGSEIEHQAFLAYWLSRFVFPKFAKDSIGETIIPLAIHLSRGTRIALAPAVLASMFKDLRSLKEALDASRKQSSSGGFHKVKLSSPLQLLQVWIWERFPTLQPRPPNPTQPDDPKMARWNLLQFDVQNISTRINSSADDFLWRPHWGSSLAHKDKAAEWVRTKPDLGQGVMELARCWRVSELVGPDADYIEQYLPHRVAKQFGMDQDVPDFVPRVNSSPQAAWEYYTRPIEDEKLYIPGRLDESSVTTRYIFWWRKLVSGTEKRPVCIDHPPGFEPKNKRPRHDLETETRDKGSGGSEFEVAVSPKSFMEDIANLEKRFIDLERDINLYKEAYSSSDLHEEGDSSSE
ncbi:serine/threonine-protein phosphatase 7 long form homolog [Henckelia pumila]|uniref:serine/threonine-protein phosphatase 7 long form homolog n=1 Tax=Henckelia pumila TaxID=405737 RepID=UPI003C6E0B77